MTVLKYNINIPSPITWKTGNSKHIRSELFKYIEHEYGIVFDEQTLLAPAIYETFIDKEYTRYPEFIPGAGEVVIDAGAQYGDYTLLCSKLGAIVHSFEPYYDICRVLRRNLIINNMGDSRVYQLALGDCISKGHFFATHGSVFGCIDGKALNPLLCEEHETKSHEELLEYLKTFNRAGELVPLKMVTLDSLSINNISYIKIDVEGFELQVLSGSRKTIELYHPKIIMETHTFDLTEKCISFLEERGYSLEHRLEPHGILYFQHSV